LGWSVKKGVGCGVQVAVWVNRHFVRPATVHARSISESNRTSSDKMIERCFCCGPPENECTFAIYKTTCVRTHHVWEPMRHVSSFVRLTTLGVGVVLQSHSDNLPRSWSYFPCLPREFECYAAGEFWNDDVQKLVAFSL
jgi:hypothetical protein